MTNLNIQQKVIIAAQKSKENQIKATNLSEEEYRLKEYNEITRPSFTEEQTGMIQKYFDKLHTLGDYKEYDIYQMMRKYDWNEKVLDNLTTVMIQKVEQLNDADDWIEIKRVRKTAPKKRTREERDARRALGTNYEETEDNYVKGRPKANFLREQRGFRKRPYRSDMVAEYGPRELRHKRDRYVKERFGGERFREGTQNKRQKIKEVKPKRTEDVYVPKHLRKEKTEEVPPPSTLRGKKGERFVYVKKVKSDVPVVPTESVAPTAELEKKEDVMVLRDTQGSQGSMESKDAGKRSRSVSPSPNFSHLEENNTQELSKKTATESTTAESEKDLKLTENPALKQKLITREENSSPFPMTLEADTTSKTAQKPLFEKPVAPKEKPQIQPEISHEQPIGPIKTQTSPQPTTTQASQGAQTKTEAKPQEATQPQEHAAFGYPQYAQQPYMMPQYPQQAFYNPYMPFYPPQQQTTGETNQTQQQGSYPPGFNPQEMAAMYQVPYMLIPGPNGTTMLQPMYQMMPPQGTGSETEQGKFVQQPFFQYGMNPNFYGTHDDKKAKHQNFEQKTQTNMGPFFNFGANEDYKANKGGYVPPQQGAGYPFMPFIMQPNMHPGQYPTQQHYHGKSTEGSNTGNRW